MAQNKTTATDASVDDYVAARADEAQKADCKVLMAIMRKVTRQQPRMWGPSIVGYGSYRYTYPSGRSGEMFLAGFAVRGREFVVYLAAAGAEQDLLLAKLGRHRMGKACLYFKRLADVDAAVLEKLIVDSVAELKRRHA